MKLVLRGSNLLESHDKVGIVWKLKTLDFEHKALHTKHNSATINRVTILRIYYKTIATNKVYYKRQVYVARSFLNEWDPAKDKTLVTLVLGWFISLLQ